MTARQTAVAASADLKWMTNSAALLGRRLRYTPHEAKWWGLVRLLTENLGVSLKAAAKAATAVLLGNSSERQITAGADPSGSTSLVVDLPRYESIFLANLSRALLQETARRRGRMRARTGGHDLLNAALLYGNDISLLQSALKRTPAERLQLLEANVEFVRAARKASK